MNRRFRIEEQRSELRIWEFYVMDDAGEYHFPPYESFSRAERLCRMLNLGNHAIAENAAHLRKHAFPRMAADDANNDTLTV